MLRNDVAVGNDDDSPVELGLEVGHNLLADLAESNDGAERNADEEGLGDLAVCLLVINQISAVDEDLGELSLQGGVVNL